MDQCSSKSLTVSTFTYQSLGHKLWKFHGETSNETLETMDDKQPPVTPGHKRDATGQNISTSKRRNCRKLTRSLSFGSVSSSSESECSSQSSMGSPDAEDLAKEFLTCPISPINSTLRKESSKPTCELVIETPSNGDKKSHETFKAKILPTPNFSLSGLVKVLSSVRSINGSGIEIIQDNKALALRLQQRRPRKALVDQGIIPPLKSPATYFEQRQKLERARTGDILNKKIQGRPERDTLIAKHILEDTHAYDSIVAHQKELKKAKLVDDLNEKIAFRPGVIELVQKNIIQTDDGLQEAIKDGQVQFRPTDDLDGDSSDAFSPEPSYQNSQGEGSGSSQPMKTIDSSPPLAKLQQNQFSSFPTSQNNHIDNSAWNNKISTSRLDATNSIVTSSSKITSSSSHVNTHPYLFRQSSGTKNTKTTQSSKRTVRKQKDKPKFKRYKYHQYIPPDQQGKQSNDKEMPKMNAHYSRVLEQQQLYLQLQIMHQHYPTILPSPQATGDKQLQDINKTYIPQGVAPVPPPPPPVTNNNRNNMGDARKRVFTEQQLEDMKVAELKEELKARSLKVTGTKEVLVERLKPFAIQTMQGSTLQPISRDIKSLINATIESTMRSNAEMTAAKTGQSGSVLLRQHNNNNKMFKSSDPPQISTSISMSNPPSNILLNSTSIIPTSTSANSRPASVVPMDSTSGQPSNEPNFQFSGTFGNQPQPSLNNHNNQTQQRQWASNNNENHVINFDGVLPLQNGGNPHVVKNQLLQEIEDLRRMVDLHKTQIRQMQVQPQNVHESALHTNGNPGSTTQQQFNMHQSNSSDNLTQENSHQDVAQMLQQHLATKIQKGPIFKQSEQQMVKQERSPPVAINEAHYSFANSPPNVTLVPLKSSNNRIPSPHVMRSSSHDNSFQLQDNKQPPEYAQAIQDKHLHRAGGASPNPSQFTDAMPPQQDASMYMDDLLELLTDKGEIPFEEQQMVNKMNEQHSHVDTKPAVHGYTMNEAHYMQQSNKPATAQQKLQMRRSFPMLEFNENNIPAMHENPQTLNRRHSEDLLAQPTVQNSTHQQHSSQFTPQMLVNTAGDILMDNNLGPPSASVAQRVHQPGCMPPEAVTLPQYETRSAYQNNPNFSMFGDSNTLLQQHHRRIGGSEQNLLEDPYNAQPFSPMDTNSCDGSRIVQVTDDRMRDPHLSASSIHDSEPALDKACNIPNNTSSCVRKYKQPLASESPRPSNSLTKCASQELLSTTPHTPHDQSMQVDELKWLDLTFGSPLPGPSLPLNHSHSGYHHSNESILDSEDNSLPLSSSLQSFETPSAFVSPTGLGANEFSMELIDQMDLNPISSSSIDTWDKMLSS